MAFPGGAYDAQASAGWLQNCQAKATNFGDVTYQVQITLLHGHSGGSVLRADANGNGYYFRSSTDGSYIFKKIFVDSSNTARQTTLATGQSPVIATGNNQANVLTIIAKGSDFYLYVNQQYINKTSDGTYKAGQIGVYIDSDASGAEAMFHDVSVWKM